MNNGKTTESITITRILAVVVAFSLLANAQQKPDAPLRAETRPPIHFSLRPIAFRLDSSETPQRHAPESMAGGVAVFDYDNDGNLDIFFTNGADIETLQKSSPKYWNRLFRNNGDGTFTDVTEKAGLQGSGFDTGVAIGDFDNDGFQDIFVGGVHHSALYHNNGDGTFSDITQKAGISAFDKQYGPLWSVGAAWVDINNDGLLDLVVLNYLAWDSAKEPDCKVYGQMDYCHPKYYRPTPNQVFLNQGDGRFREMSAEAGIREHPGKAMGIGVADYNHDGLPDLFITNDKLANFLFQNVGGGRFREVAFQAGVALPEDGNDISGMGVDFQDLNNDGFPDIFLVALEQETFPLYRNDGKGFFSEITAQSGMATLSGTMSGYSPNIVDFDNDGWKDIFVSRGGVQSPPIANLLHRPVEQRNSVFRNLHDGRWSALTEEAGFGGLPPSRHRGSAYGDFNHDGKVDVVVSAISAPAEVWMNDSAGENHWLEISLQGTKSNRNGIGARIKVSAGGQAQYLFVTTTSGYASSSAGPCHFGLGTAKTVEEVEVDWPSGIKQVLRNIRADQIFKVKESQ